MKSGDTINSIKKHQPNGRCFLIELYLMSLAFIILPLGVTHIA